MLNIHPIFLGITRVLHLSYFFPPAVKGVVLCGLMDGGGMTSDLFRWYLYQNKRCDICEMQYKSFQKVVDILIIVMIVTKWCVDLHINVTMVVC